MIAFTVHGTPVPQGSMKSIGKGRMISDNKHLKGWRTRARMAAQIAGQSAPTLSITRAKTVNGKRFKFDCHVNYNEPVIVRARFYFDPTGKNHRGDPHFNPPDLDKLQRAIGDALESAGVVFNDSRICAWDTLKFYGTPRAEICVMGVSEVQGERMQLSVWDRWGI